MANIQTIEKNSLGDDQSVLYVLCACSLNLLGALSTNVLKGISQSLKQKQKKESIRLLSRVYLIYQGRLRH